MIMMIVGISRHAGYSNIFIIHVSMFQTSSIPSSSSETVSVAVVDCKKWNPPSSSGESAKGQELPVAAIWFPPIVCQGQS